MAEPFTVRPARYAKGQLLVQPERRADGLKTRAARLLEALHCRWTHREHGYIASPTKVARFQLLFSAGWDANFFSNQLTAPNPDP